VGLPGSSVLPIKATRVTDPASVVVVIAVAFRSHPAAGQPAAGAAAAQLGSGSGRGWSAAGLLLSVGALAE
jgi:hypothetical protein